MGDSAAASQGDEMTGKRDDSDDLPIACTLTPTELAESAGRSDTTRFQALLDR